MIKIPEVCIYCDRKRSPSSELTTEHIIPKALGGYNTYPKSSCKICNYKTSAFEAKVLRGAFYAFREKTNLTSRSKNRPITLPLFAINGDEKSRLDIPIEDYPAMLMLPKYFKAKILCDDGYDSEPCKPWLFTETHDLSKLTFKYGITSFATMSIDSLSFGRMLCKIGHSWACKYQLNRRFMPFLTRLIIEDRGHEFLNFVGISQITPPSIGLSHISHTIRLFEQSHKLGKLLVCEVTLFANLGSPTYHIVVGLIPDSDNEAEFPKIMRIKIPKHHRITHFRAVVKIDGSVRRPAFDKFAPDVMGNFSNNR